MAKTYVYYADGQKEYCFKCAVLAVIKDGVKIHVESTAYEFLRCETCGDYLQDEIVI